MGKANEMSVRLNRVLLDQIAGQWHLLILGALCDHGRKARFNARSEPSPAFLRRRLHSVCANLSAVALSHDGSLPIRLSASNIPLRHSGIRSKLRFGL